MTRSVRFVMSAGAVGAILLGAGFVLDLRRALFGYLAAYVCVASIAVGSVFFIAIAHTIGAGWMAVLRRRAENVASVFPALTLLFLPIAARLPLLYPWAAPSTGWTDEQRALIVPKLAYLNGPFFIVRALVYLLSWTLIAEWLRRMSRSQDEAKDDALVERQRRVSAAVLPWLAFTITFAAFDWLMSLDPTWSSNVFGIYLFSGGFGASCGLLALLVFGPFPSRLREGTPGQAHALGRILLTFVIFWTYIAFTQYLLVWLADVPGEIGWVRVRTSHGWGTVAVALAIGHFLLPFAALLSRDLKLRPRVLSVIGAWLVLAHAVDLCWVVLPQGDVSPRLSPSDLGAFLVIGCAAALLAIVRAESEPAIPRNDPAAVRGMAYEAST